MINRKSVFALRCSTFLLLGTHAAIAAPAFAREGVDASATYVADVTATATGGDDGVVRYLDNLELALDADLGPLVGLDGTAVHFGLLSNAGARPNDGVGTLEGINNIEVGRSAIRLFEAWLEHSIGKTSIRAGLYDVNSEFYASDSSGLLIAPPFGIGSELAATGRSGPSIFPSSALAVRVKTALPVTKGYVQVAAVNAKAQTFGDPGGVDLGFDDGVLLVAEAGGGDRFRASLGGWTYTKANDALASVDAGGNPLRDRARGLYGIAEYRLLGGDQRDLTGFVRGGIARGKSVVFANSLQVGLTLSPLISGRPDSVASLGFHQAHTSNEFRAAQVLAGDVPWRRERAFEFTLSDQLTPFLAVQPDIQAIERHGAAGERRTGVQLTMRFTFSI